MFTFFEFKVKAGLENWEEDSLEQRLDKLGLGFIEFNEFNEFCMQYGISFNEPLLENDLEDQLERRNNISYIDYKVQKEDYFRYFRTIYTSERAALHKAQALYE